MAEQTQTLRQVVTEIMKNKGISQTKAAEILGMSQGSLSRDLGRNVKVDSLVKIIEGLNGSVLIEYPTGKIVKLKPKE